MGTTLGVSANGLAIIRKYEGFRDEAYLDPVGVPTIGYGTTIYSNGQPVRMGDTISLGEAEGELKFECDEVAGRLAEHLDGVVLNQNQADALISFCYNLGVGALLGSTLLKRLKAGNLTAAADEFLQWNKATIRGVKTVLEGLSSRRADERALFVSSTAEGKPILASVSPAENVVRAVGYRDGNANVVVALAKDNSVVEIVEMGNSNPAALSALFKTYPNLSVFDIAALGQKEPEGDRIVFAGLPPPIIATTAAPKLNSALLMFGSEDDDAADHNVKQMQARLADLGYFHSAIDGVFGPMTDKAVRDFQADFFGPSEADGLVGPLTWAKLWGDAKSAPPVASPRQSPGQVKTIAGKPASYLKLTKAGSRDQYGLEILTLAYYRDGQMVGSLNACSGQSRRQIFRKGVDSPAGSMEPLPEGKWSISDIHWKDGSDNYSGAVWSNGLGPAKIELTFEGPQTTARGEIEIHIDWNRKTSPGTAGCLGILNVADYKTLVAWLRDTDPNTLFVDWGLNSYQAP
jgi:lysozyme